MNRAARRASPVCRQREEDGRNRARSGLDRVSDRHELLSTRCDRSVAPERPRIPREPEPKHAVTEFRPQDPSRRVLGIGSGWVGVAASLAACAGAGTAPTPTIAPTPTTWTLEILGCDGQPSVVLISDTTGLVVGVRGGSPVELTETVRDIAATHASDDNGSVGAAWVSLPCERHRWLVVSDRDGMVSLSLRRETPITDTCESLGVANGLTLQFSQPVTIGAIRVEPS